MGFDGNGLKAGSQAENEWKDQPHWASQQEALRSMREVWGLEAGEREDKGTQRGQVKAQRSNLWVALTFSSSGIALKEIKEQYCSAYSFQGHWSNRVLH